jgi:hypothetical protein
VTGFATLKIPMLSRHRAEKIYNRSDSHSIAGVMRAPEKTFHNGKAKTGFPTGWNIMEGKAQRDVVEVGECRGDEHNRWPDQ